MKIFDANCMIGLWPVTELKFYEVNGLIKHMDYYGIESALIYSSHSVKHNPVDGNITLMNEIKPFSERLLPCWVVLPNWKMESGDDLRKQLKADGIRCVRMFPAEHNYVPDEWLCGELYETLEDAKVPLFIQNDNMGFSQIYSICKNHPKLPVVITNAEYTHNRNLYGLLEKCDNLSLEVSTYLSFNGVEDLAAKFGVNRLIFGSKMPFQEAGTTIKMLQTAKLSENEKAMIFYENIRKILEDVAL